MDAANEEETEPIKRLRSLEKSRTSTCTFADVVATLSLNVFRSFKIDDADARAALHSPSVQTCVAAVVMLDERNELVVCSVGAGTKIVSESDAETDLTGQRVFDCHAEVLARRGFMRFLYSQLRGLRAGSESILVQELERVRVRDGISFHLYSSSAPCGNACVRRWAKGVGEKFREDLGPHEWPEHVHQDNGRLQVHSPLQFTVLCKVAMSTEPPENEPKYDPDEIPPGTTLPSARNASSRATCSDKIARWVALGMEGSLLNSLFGSSFNGIKPSTVIVGRKFSRPHLERAVCCRLNKFWNKDERRPSVLCTSVKVQDGGKDAEVKATFTDYAIVWAREPDRQYPPQVLVASEGVPLLVNEEPLVSRRSFWLLYHDFLKGSSPDFTQELYSSLKRSVTEVLRRNRKEILLRQFLKPWPQGRFRQENQGASLN